MSIKKIALIAATLAITTTAASANNSFYVGENLEAGSVLELGLVRADQGGVVKIFDYTAGEQGELLGTQTLVAGANPDVRVNVGAYPTSDVLAVIEVNGQTVVTKDYNIVR